MNDTMLETLNNVHKSHQKIKRDKLHLILCQILNEEQHSFACIVLPHPLSKDLPVWSQLS